MPRDITEVIMDDRMKRIGPARFPDDAYGVPRKLKCSGCQLGEHCNGEDEDCYCECTATRDTLP